MIDSFLLDSSQPKDGWNRLSRILGVNIHDSDDDSPSLHVTLVRSWKSEVGESHKIER
jgi:hypothetical protein